MKHSSVELNDLPDEILMIILKKLYNVQVLYSLIGVNKRLDTIVNDSIFTNNLTLLTRNAVRRAKERRPRSRVFRATIFRRPRC